MSHLLFTISPKGDLVFGFIIIAIIGLLIHLISSLPHTLFTTTSGILGILAIHNGALLTGLLLLLLLSSYTVFVFVQHGDQLNSLITKEFNSIRRQAKGGNALTINSGENYRQREIILSAFNTLRSSESGALIVVKHNDDISTIVKGGTEVNATLSTALLVSIFNKAAPLHDGAVIIDGMRVVNAGVVLPLSNSDIHKGTRHRAGFGISEQSDCTVYILSEETGSITCVRNGAIVRESGLED